MFFNRCIFTYKTKKSIDMDTTRGKNLKEGSAICRPQLITIEDLAAFKDELLHEIKKLLSCSSDKSGKSFLRSSEVRKMLSISAGTLQNLRGNGTLPCTKVGGIFFYDQKDIARMLESPQSAVSGQARPRQCSSIRK